MAFRSAGRGRRGAGSGFGWRARPPSDPIHTALCLRQRLGRGRAGRTTSLVMTLCFAATLPTEMVNTEHIVRRLYDIAYLVSRPLTVIGSPLQQAREPPFFHSFLVFLCCLAFLLGLANDHSPVGVRELEGAYGGARRHREHILCTAGRRGSSIGVFLG